MIFNVISFVLTGTQASSSKALGAEGDWGERGAGVAAFIPVIARGGTPTAIYIFLLGKRYTSILTRVSKLALEPIL